MSVQFTTGRSAYHRSVRVGERKPIGDIIVIEVVNDDDYRLLEQCYYTVTTYCSSLFISWSVYGMLLQRHTCTCMCDLRHTCTCVQSCNRILHNIWKAFPFTLRILSLHIFVCVALLETGSYSTSSVSCECASTSLTWYSLWTTLLNRIYCAFL